MVSAHEIRQKWALVAKGKLSLNSFEDWFVPKSWNAHKDSSPEAIDLVSSIHLLLSERDNHALGESDLRKELAALLSNYIHYVQIEYFSAPAPVRRRPIIEIRPSSAPVYARVQV